MSLMPASLPKNPLDLAPIIAIACRADTSSDPAGWSRKNPLYGHCAVVAMVVSDLYGGDIVWAEAVKPDGSKESHYFNLIHGVQYDLTAAQFPAGTSVPVGRAKTKGFATTRDYVASYQPTCDRYYTLRARLGLA